WITQPIDHFGANNGTWKQKYMVNAEHYKPGGPIYILTPGESEVSKMYTEDTHFSKIVFVGGSYGGALAAWMRAIYPDLVTAAWASSAPVFTYIDFYQLDQALGRHLTARGCGESFAQGVKDLDAILLSNNSSGLDSVRKMFSVTGNTAQDIAASITGAITSTVNLPVMLSGDALDQSDSNITAYRSELVDREYWQGGCRSSFGPDMHPLTDVTEQNRKWLGLLKGVTNIYYTVGELDPWRDTTVATANGTLLDNTTSAPIFVMNGATHTQDMQPDTLYDLNSVRMAKEMGDSLIKKWIL
ncbi:hypothetical protein IW146_010450, partial [Coemansia sp. RSA 922]